MKIYRVITVQGFMVYQENLVFYLRDFFENFLGYSGNISSIFGVSAYGRRNSIFGRSAYLCSIICLPRFS